MKAKHWWVQFLIAIDQLLNVMVTPLQGSAWADETLSARAWRAERDGKWFGRIFRPLIDRIFFWQDGHCAIAYQREKERAQVPPEYRTVT